jgi:hypothetical protein
VYNNNNKKIREMQSEAAASSSSTSGNQKRRAHTDDSLKTKPAQDGALTTTTSSTTDDIDLLDKGSIECLVEYVNDTFHDLKEEERRLFPLLRPLSSQVDINGKMRALLVDWLFDVRRKFKLRYETLYAALSLLDRYLSIVTVRKSQLQECGCAALMLASTLEETYPPEARDYVHVSDNSFEAEALKTHSWRIAAALQFNLWSPNPLHFLRRYSKASRNSTAEHNLAKYYCQSATLNYHRLVSAYLPSKLAASSILLARLAQTESTKSKPWSRTLAHYTGYTIADLADCVATLWLWLKFVLCNVSWPSLRAAQKEYALASNQAVSRQSLPTADKLECVREHLSAHLEFVCDNAVVSNDELLAKRCEQLFSLY